MINLLFIVIGFILLVKGADYLVDGASQVAKRFNLPEIIIGLTIVSIGTSLPELMVSLTSAINSHSDIAIGNVIGSNISNLFLILGICATIRPLKFKDETIRFEIPFIIFLTAMLYIFGNNGVEKLIDKQEGLILIILCVLFVLYNIWMASRSINDISHKLEIEEAKNNFSMFKSTFKIILGIVLLKYGGDFVVDNASEMASKLGVSEKMVSLTIVSISTSLPELITSITATLRNEIDMAIGNVMGSNIFNIVLIVGVTAFINPIVYSMSYNKDIIIFLIGMFAIAIIPFIGEKNKISRWNGLGYVISYISYMISLIYVNLL